MHRPFIAALMCCCCCFSHSAYWLPTRKKLLYTMANPARGLLNREKRTKENVWQYTPPPHPPTLLVRRKINKITRRIYRRYAGLGRSRVRTRIPSARRLGQWVWLCKILHSRLRYIYSPPRGKPSIDLLPPLSRLLYCDVENHGREFPTFHPPTK